MGGQLRDIFGDIRSKRREVEAKKKKMKKKKRRNQKCQILFTVKY